MSFRHLPPTVALIGLGHQGLKHFQSLFQLQGEGQLKIVGLVDVIQTDFTLKYPFFVDYQEMLTALHPDIVVIATPNFLHYSQTLAALKTGAYVIKEKPLAMSLAQGSELLEVARQTNRLIFTCQQRQHSFLWQTAAEQVLKLGQIQSFSYNLTLEDEKYSWYWDEEQGGGAWLNLGWHGVQMVEWLLGPIAELRVAQKRGGSRPWRYTTDHLSLAQVKLASGARGKIFVSSIYPDQELLRVEGSRGSLNLKNQRLLVRQDGRAAQSWYSPESKQEWYTDQLRAALAVFANNHDSMDLELRVLQHLESGLLTSKGKNVKI